MPRIYRDRLGRPITDPAVIEARRILTLYRRRAAIGVRAGRSWDRTVTVSELATAANVTVGQIVMWARTHDAWLLGIIENGDAMGDWFVYEDGE
jgi:hypothetical protein